MSFYDCIKPDLLILLPVLYLVGVFLKKSRLPDNRIPLVLGGCAILLALIRVFAGTPIRSAADFFTALFTAVTQGVLIAGATVYGHQIYKQSKK